MSRRKRCVIGADEFIEPLYNRKLWKKIRKQALKHVPVRDVGLGYESLVLPVESDELKDDTHATP